MTTLTEFPKGFCNIKQDIKFWNIPRVHFLQSEWEEPKLRPDRISWQYLVWRGTYASFCIFAFIISFLTGTTQKYWFLFLTNWSLIIQLIYSLLYFTNNFLAWYIKPRLQDSDTKYAIQQMPTSIYGVDMKNSSPSVSVTKNVWLEKNTCLESVIWFLMGLAVMLPVLGTIGFWLTVSVQTLTSLEFSRIILLHGINACFSLVDIFVIAIPVHVTQFVVLMSFGLIYILFSYLYEETSGQYPPSCTCIYWFLNWREHPERAVIFSSIAALLLILLYLILWLLYILRLYLVIKCSCRSDRDSCRELHRYWIKYDRNKEDSATAAPQDNSLAALDLIGSQEDTANPLLLGSQDLLNSEQ